jgi:hypothetical protein
MALDLVSRFLILDEMEINISACLMHNSKLRYFSTKLQEANRITRKLRVKDPSHCSSWNRSTAPLVLGSWPEQPNRHVNHH